MGGNESIQIVKKVYMFFPNKYIARKKFDWCLFGNKTFNHKLNQYVLSVNKNTRFFEPSTGSTYKSIENIEFLITQKCEINNFQHEFQKKDSNICGCIIKKDFNKKISPLNFYLDVYILCSQNFVDISNENCELVRFSKMMYPTLIKYDNSFPSPLVIDQTIKKYGCRIVCQSLFNRLYSINTVK